MWNVNITTNLPLTPPLLSPKGKEHILYKHVFIYVLITTFSHEKPKLSSTQYGDERDQETPSEKRLRKHPRQHFSWNMGCILNGGVTLVRSTMTDRLGLTKWGSDGRRVSQTGLTAMTEPRFKVTWMRHGSRRSTREEDLGCGQETEASGVGPKGISGRTTTQCMYANVTT